MRRTLYGGPHEAFRRVVAEFLRNEAIPRVPTWEAAGQIDRDFFERAATIGLMGISLPERFGGAGETDYRYSAVVAEEAADARLSLGTLRLQTDVVLPYLLRLGSEEQHTRWLPAIAKGQLLTAIAMSEPDAGSDLTAIRTRATNTDAGFVLNGTKTFITGGAIADIVVVVARTSASADRHDGLSMLVVEDGMPGFVRGRKLDKLGLRYQDTVELHFSDVVVPRRNLLGDEGRAFLHLQENLAQERLSIAITSLAMARRALRDTIAYTRERTVFGSPLSSMQHTRFVLADLATAVEAGQHLLDRAVEEHTNDSLSAADAALAKLYCTELQGRVLDQCLQLHGGYGYVRDYPIADMYADARVSRIYGGTSEVMRLIISKALGL